MAAQGSWLLISRVGDVWGVICICADMFYVFFSVEDELLDTHVGKSCCELLPQLPFSVKKNCFQADGPLEVLFFDMFFFRTDVNKKQNKEKSVLFLYVFVDLEHQQFFFVLLVSQASFCLSVAFGIGIGITGVSMMCLKPAHRLKAIDWLQLQYVLYRIMFIVAFLFFFVLWPAVYSSRPLRYVECSIMNRMMWIGQCGIAYSWQTNQFMTVTRDKSSVPVFSRGHMFWFFFFSSLLMLISYTS